MLNMIGNERCPECRKKVNLNELRLQFKHEDIEIANQVLDILNMYYIKEFYKPNTKKRITKKSSGYKAFPMA